MFSNQEDLPETAWQWFLSKGYKILKNSLLVLNSFLGFFFAGFYCMHQIIKERNWSVLIFLISKCCQNQPLQRFEYPLIKNIYQKQPGTGSYPKDIKF